MLVAKRAVGECSRALLGSHVSEELSLRKEWRGRPVMGAETGDGIEATHLICRSSRPVNLHVVMARRRRQTRLACEDVDGSGSTNAPRMVAHTSRQSRDRIKPPSAGTFLFWQFSG